MKKKPISGSAQIERNRAKLLYDARRPGYDDALQNLYKNIRKLLETHGFSPSIKYRVKRFEAYFEKLRNLQEKGKPGGRARLSDMLGLRIVCPFLEDIETIKDLITSNFEVAEIDWKATQHSFREFGYDSVHMLVKLEKGILRETIPGTRRVCEVQLRTILQDAWAEVEHELVYKSDIAIPNESIRRKLASLNATLTLSDLIFQEIRDYQKAIRQRSRKRQEQLTDSLDILDIMATSEQFEDTPKTQNNKNSYSPGTANQLEKTMLLALDAHSGHDLQTAIRLYGKLLGMRLNKEIRSLVYNHRGMAYFANSEIGKAIKDFSKAISYNPENSRGYANRGQCYRIIREHEKALSDFDTAINIAPLSLESYYGRARTFKEMGRFAKALTDCEKALEINSDFQPARDLAKSLRKSLA